MFLEPTVVRFDALPLSVRQQLSASLRGHASPIPTLFSPAVARPGALLAMVRAWRARRRMAWTPGRYVLGAYLLDASSEVLRFESALAVEATDVVHHHHEGVHVVTSIAFRTKAHVYEFNVDRRADARLALDRLEADLVALVDAIRYGELEAIARLDPLFEARLIDLPLVACQEVPPTVAPRP